MADRLPNPGQKCSYCGRPAYRQCSCGCGAAYCLLCKREGKVR